MLAAQAVYGAAPGSDHFRGLYISQDEVRRLLDREPGASILTAQEKGADEYQTASTYNPELTRLQRAFGLSSFDLDVILIALAPELDLRYERLYAYLQDDVTKKRPSVNLVLDLLCPTFETKVAARQRFDSKGPLISHRLVTVFAEAPDRFPPFLAQFVKLDERIVGYLLGSDQPDVRLLPFVRWGEPRLAWSNLILPEDIKGRLEQLVERYREGTARTSEGDGQREGIVLYLQGPTGVGKQATAEALCGELGIPLLVVDVGHLLNGDLSFEAAARLLFREALLQRAGLYFDRFDLLLAEEGKVRHYRQTVIEELERSSGLIILAGGTGWEPSGAFYRKTFVRVELPYPSYRLRKQLWEASLDGVAPRTLTWKPWLTNFA